MVNKEVAAAFDAIADLMEIVGEDRFRVNTYRKVARTIGDLTDDVAELAQGGSLTKIPGVGKGSAERIEQYLATGEIDVHQELLAKVPEGLPDLLRIPGLGPKKVGLVWRELGVADMDRLMEAIESGALAELGGMGVKSAAKIREGIEFLRRSAGRAPIGVAMPMANALVQKVQDLDGVDKVIVAGSLRRGKETCGDVDILCQSDRGGKVVEAFTGFEEAEQVLAAGETKGSIVAKTRGGRAMQVDLRVVGAESFGAVMQYFTGSKEHNVRLRELAIKKGYKLNEYGLFKGDTQVAGATEEGVYTALGLPWIPPELREDRGEIEAAGKGLPELVSMDDLRGDLHMHTPASDGRHTAEAMAEAAKAMGYAYIAITDHSASSVIANGLSIDRMWRQIETVREANTRVEGIAVLVGTEVDILAEGKLDYPDDLLAACDVVIASIHSGLGQAQPVVTKRTLVAMEHPHVHIIGHPSGRLINKREAMDLDMDEVVRAASRTGTALEVNASWQRLDLNDVHVRQAIDAGAMLAINTDAHATEQLEFMLYGVQTARRGWATAANVVNTRTLAGLRKWLGCKGN